MKATILKWELGGVVVIFLSGSVLHFVFDWAREWPPAALIAAVNESVWEHLKLAFWPGLIYGLIEFLFLKAKTKNFWVAKTCGLFTMPVIIAAVFYGYTALTGSHILWLDIALFGLAVVAGQVISFALMVGEPFGPKIRIAAGLVLVLMIVAFSLFSYLPPRWPLFQDSSTGQYGILK
ncbi:MAG: hypothetical protein GTN73_02130 [Candidatus Aminicenantes bacterium]|nr:hypothetical protein [Candidatus Aminicenantes bacterium]